MPIHRVLDLQINRGGRTPTPNKEFHGTRYNKWKAGRKRGKEGGKERRQDLLSFSFVSYAVQGPFTYISLLPHCFSEQIKAQKDKMICPRPKSQ